MLSKYSMSGMYRQHVETAITSEKAAMQLARQMARKSLEEVVTELSAATSAWVEWIALSRLERALHLLGYDDPAAARLSTLILHQQGRKIEQYEAKAFKLSERQLETVLRDMHSLLAAIGKADIEAKKQQAA